MCQGRFGLGIRENFYLERVKQCPGNGGDPIPGNVQIPHGGGFVPIQGIIQSVPALFRFVHGITVCACIIQVWNCRISLPAPEDVVWCCWVHAGFDDLIFQPEQFPDSEKVAGRELQVPLSVKVLRSV